MKTAMKTLRFLILSAAALTASLRPAAAADKFVFSSDGQTAGSAARELPTQGVSLTTGRVIVGLHALGDAERADCGWYRVVPGERPTAHSNEVWRVSGYSFDAGGTCAPTWECFWRKVKPRTFSKMRIVAALKTAGVWPQVKAWMEEADLYDLYLAAQDFAEDDPNFLAGRAALQQLLGWTDEQVEAVLQAGASK